MDFLANKFLRQLVCFLVGFLGVALFSFAFNQRTAVAAFSSIQPSSHQAQISLWRNPSHQELNFYQ